MTNKNETTPATALSLDKAAVAELCAIAAALELVQRGLKTVTEGELQHDHNPFDLTISDLVQRVLALTEGGNQ